MRLVVIDYGAGNLRSVAKALVYLGYEPIIAESPEPLGSADALLLPGVGAAGDTMQALKRLGLVQPIRDYVASGRPFFGICVGMQVLLGRSEESGEEPCLGIVPGQVRRLPPGLKVPHIGWNQVRQLAPHPLFAGIPDEMNFYFVHSYYCEPADRTAVVGETDYGLAFCSVLAKDSLVAVQFHPEKSGDAGLEVYRNFLRLAAI